MLPGLPVDRRADILIRDYPTSRGSTQPLRMQLAFSKASARERSRRHLVKMVESPDNQWVALNLARRGVQEASRLKHHQVH